MSAQAKNESPTDAELVLDYRANRDPSSASFRELHARHFARIRSICRKLTGNAEDAYDMAQETFLALTRHIDRFKPDGSFAAWSGRIAANACLALRRSARVRATVSIDQSEPNGSGDSALALPDHRAQPPGTALEQREVAAEVHQAVGELVPGLRQAVQLRYFHGLSNPQIAARLGLSDGAVRCRMFRAHRGLRDLLAERELMHCA